MSLDVYLDIPGGALSGQREAIFVRRCGATVEVSPEEWDDLHPGIKPVVVTAGLDNEPASVYRANITHNLGKMARAAGIYEALWRPEEIGIKKAYDLIGYLSEGLALLKSDPARFKAFDAPNGWGTYDDLVSFTQKYLEACVRWPDALVSVSR